MPNGCEGAAKSHLIDTWSSTCLPSAFLYAAWQTVAGFAIAGAWGAYAVSRPFATRQVSGLLVELRQRAEDGSLDESYRYALEGPACSHLYCINKFLW
jgi:hypothetical protein